MATVDLGTQDSRLVAGRQSPATLGLVAAAFVSFLVAAAVIFDTYAQSQLLDDYVQAPASPRQPSEIIHLPAPEGSPEQPSRRPVERPKGDDAPPRPAPPPGASDREILADIVARQAETQEGVAAIRRELAAQPPASGTATFEQVATIERHLGAVAGQTELLETLVVARVPDEARPEIAAGFRRLRASVTAAQRAAAQAREGRSGGGASAALALPSETVPPLLAASVAVQTGSPAERAAPSAAELAWFKIYVIFGIFAVLGIAFLIAVGAVFTTANPATLAFATDTVKTMLGFFIGVATGFLGGPS